MASFGPSQEAINQPMSVLTGPVVDEVILGVEQVVPHVRHRDGLHALLPLLRQADGALERTGMTIRHAEQIPSELNKASVHVGCFIKETGTGCTVRGPV